MKLAALHAEDTAGLEGGAPDVHPVPRPFFGHEVSEGEDADPDNVDTVAKLGVQFFDQLPGEGDAPAGYRRGYGPARCMALETVGRGHRRQGLAVSGYWVEG